MTNNTYYASEIKAAVKVPDMLRFYGFKLNAKNRMPCPFHNGKDDNLGAKDDFYNCFVCGAKGDIFQFVQEYFSLSFPEALAKLNEDFAVGLPIGKKLSRQQQMEIGRKAFERRRALEAKQKEQEAVEAEYWAAYDEWLRLDNIVRYQKPKSPELATPEYIEALAQIQNAKYNLDCAERRRWEYEQTG